MKFTPILVVLVIVGIVGVSAVFLMSGEPNAAEVSNPSLGEAPARAPGGMERPQRPAPIQNNFPDPVIPEPEPENRGLNVVINEVEANPSGLDAGNEWVELFNPLSEAVDIGRWEIVTTHDRTESFTFASGTTIPAGRYLVIQFPSQFIDNEDELLILRNDLGNEVDRTPVLDDSQNDNRTWQRKVEGLDHDQDDDWVFLPESRQQQ